MQLLSYMPQSEAQTRHLDHPSCIWLKTIGEWQQAAATATAAATAAAAAAAIKPAPS